MPELPEVEEVRRSLEPQIVGSPARRVVGVRVYREDFVTVRGGTLDELIGRRFSRTHRHGKKLFLVTEKEGATTTKIELIPPTGVAIDSFSAEPGWTRAVKATGSGENAVIQDVTWTGGSVPTDEDSVFHFVATLTSAKTFTFTVKQTYSDGTIVDWSGPESSDTPAPLVVSESSLGGGSGSTLPIIALVVAGIALLLGIAALFGGKRTIA